MKFKFACYFFTAVIMERRECLRVKLFRGTTVLLFVITTLSLLGGACAYSSQDFNLYSDYAQNPGALRLDFNDDDDMIFNKQREALIRKEILNMLGLHHAPKPLRDSKHNSAPKFMLELYKQLELNFLDEGYSIPRDHDVIHYNFTSLTLESQAIDADMIVSFVNREITDARGYKEINNNIFTFESQEIPDVEKVLLAEVRVFKNPVYAHAGSSVFTLELERIAAERLDGSRVTEHVTKTEVTPHFHGWLDLNVTSAVASWLGTATSDIQFLLTVRNNNGTAVAPSEVGLTNQNESEDTNPFMVAFFKAVPIKTNLRQRRDVARETKATSRDSQQNKYRRRLDNSNRRTQKRRLIEAPCHREAFLVRFQDLKWEGWIIAPDDYAAFYCTGRCAFPLNAHMNATNHAIVQTLVALMRPRRVPSPCCAPTKLNPISVLYLDEGSNVILRKFQNMVVTACGCH